LLGRSNHREGAQRQSDWHVSRFLTAELACDLLNDSNYRKADSAFLSNYSAVGEHPVESFSAAEWQRIGFISCAGVLVEAVTMSLAVKSYTTTEGLPKEKVFAAGWKAAVPESVPEYGLEAASLGQTSPPRAN